MLLPEKRYGKRHLLKAFKRPHLHYDWKEGEGFAMQRRERKRTFQAGINKGKTTKQEKSWCVQKSKKGLG